MKRFVDEVEHRRRPLTQDELGPLFAQLPDNGTPTSRAAARRAAPRAGSKRVQILSALRQRPQGMTRAELVVVTGLKENTVNPRVFELVEAKWVEERGERGERAILWITGAGLNALVAAERSAA